MSVPARTMPWSEEAEKSVLGGILLYQRALVEVIGVVDPPDFYHPAHGAIFAAMVELDAAGRPVDAITVAEQMKATDTFHKLRAMNGESYFAELTSAVVTVENIGYHARIVRSKATVRRLIETAQEIAAKGYGDYEDAEDYLRTSQEAVFSIAQRDIGSRLVTQQESLAAAVREVERSWTRRQEGKAPPGIPTGFSALDEHIAGGWQREFVLIGGRPSSGKTSFVMEFAEYAARSQYPVLVVSTEMRHEALTLRRLSSAAEVDGWKLRAGYLDTEEWKRLHAAAVDLSTATLWYEDSANDLQSLRAIIRRWRANPEQGGRLDADGKPYKAMVVVDYLQEVQLRSERDEARGKQRFGSREEEISKIGSGLKKLGKALDLTMVAVVSLNRELEKRDDKRPRNSDLRESGALEFQADVIGFVYRDVVYNPQADEREAELIITKMREGKIGTVPLTWWKEYTSFRAARDMPPELPQPDRPTKRPHPRSRRSPAAAPPPPREPGDDDDDG